MLKKKLFAFYFILFVFENLLPSLAKSNECEWDNESGPCITINSSLPNSSEFTYDSVKKKIISKNDIENLNAKDLVDVLETIPEISITRSGPAGQQTSIFFRGTNSNHTL